MSTLLRRFLLLAFSTFGLFAHASDELMYDGPRAYFNLDGDWNVLPIAGLDFQFPPPADGWKKETVPNLGGSPSLDEPGGGFRPGLEAYVKDGQFIRKSGMAAWFKRDFVLPKDLPAGARVRLNFGGVGLRSDVWLNGKKVGHSVMGLLPVSYDVTDMIVPGGANELVLGLTGREGLIDLANKLYVIPSNRPAGIWGSVELQFIPPVNIDDVFVKPSVPDKRLDMDVTVVNTGSQPANISVRAVVTDSKFKPVTQVPAVEATLAPGETKVVTLTKNWLGLLWSPISPTLYFTRVEIGQNGIVTDSKTVRFGCRQFEIRGRDFYLNGQKMTLLRNSWIAGGDKEQMFAATRFEAGNPINAVRTHLGTHTPAALDMCDELGFVCMPESSWTNGPEVFPSNKADLWLPNLVAYQKELIKQNRNRPSVVMWDLTNETFWGKTDPDDMKVADALIAAAKEMDPTRPQEGDAEYDWGGRLPVINIHYPESSNSNSLRDKYPDSGFVFPNDYHWLSKDKENSTGTGKFNWDRPLIVGENWFADGDADHFSSFMGESVYDWEKWTFQRIDGRDQGEVDDNEFVNSQEGVTDGYRQDGAAGVNPWASNGQRAMPAICVRPVDFFPNFFGGTIGTRKFVVFNDSLRGYGMILQCRLSIGERTLWSTTVNADPIVELPISCPAVDHQTEATLTVRLCYDQGGLSQLYRYRQEVFILPPEKIADVPAKTTFLLDKTGATAKALASLGLNLTPSPTVTAGDLQGFKVLVVGENTDPTEFKDAIVDFVRNGGSAIVLRQDNWVPLTDELPETDKLHVSTRSWRRVFDHPITAGLDDRQLSYWRPDHLVSQQTFRKPSSGLYRALIDTGGTYGMRWASLVEIPMGRGTFVLSSQPLADRVGVEPVAGHLLANMIRYGLAFQPVPREPLRLLAGVNAPLRATLTTAGVNFHEGPDGAGPVLLDSTFDVSDAQLGQLKSYLGNGGKIWVHGFGPDSIGKIASLFPFTPTLQAYDPKIQGAIRRSEDPIMDGLSTFDFFWTIVALNPNGDYFSSGNPTAKLGGSELKLPTLDSGVPLLQPNLLVKIPAGKGTLLYDSLFWETALGAETDKVTRIVSTLATNLGADVRAVPAEAPYTYTPVDISKQANMGYYDKVADDGQGGWTDQGENDMRFFLINHVGKGGGVESGMEVEAQVFPTDVTMAGRKFTLLDPRKTANHAIISLRGQDHGAKLPSSALGIAYGKKADKLWFLQACGWAPQEPNQEVARYVMHYADGTQEIFSIHYGQEISEWWNPKPLSKAKVAWTGRNLMQSPIGIYVTEWANPHPEKEIASIDMIGNLTPTQVVLLGITGGIAADDKNRQTILGDWRMGDFVDNAVPNQIKDGPALKNEDPKNPPTVTTLDGLPALHFHGGQSVTGDFKFLPESGGLGDGKPFSVKMILCPDALPSGYCGGLFEAGYGGAFRMTLGSDMKIGVESWVGPGKEERFFGSTAPLEIGHTYNVEVRFDGTYGALLINGQVDKMIVMGLPSPSKNQFNIGVAGGTNYFFNGSISRVTICALPDSSPPAL
jgi:hypothetical protein